MTTYCYSDHDGGPVWEQQFPMGEAPHTIEVFGVAMFRDFQAEQRGHRSVNPWEDHYCLPFGARTTEHAAEIAAKCADAHVSCEFDKNLNVKVDSPSHQKRLAKAIFPGQNVVNRDSFH